MGVVKGQDHTVSLSSNWFAFFCFVFLFHINQITILEIQLFWNLTLKNQRSRSWVKSRVGVILFTQYPTDAPPFRFISIGPTIPEICPKECLTLKKHIRNFQRKFAQIEVSTKIPPKCNQVISMTWAIYLPSFVMIGWSNLTLTCRQANFCLSMPQPWPWFKVMERSSSTFSQTHTFFVPNI